MIGHLYVLSDSVAKQVLWCCSPIFFQNNHRAAKSFASVCQKLCNTTALIFAGLRLAHASVHCMSVVDTVPITRAGVYHC